MSVTQLQSSRPLLRLPVGGWDGPERAGGDLVVFLLGRALSGKVCVYGSFLGFS